MDHPWISKLQIRVFASQPHIIARCVLRFLTELPDAMKDIA